MILDERRVLVARQKEGGRRPRRHRIGEGLPAEHELHLAHRLSRAKGGQEHSLAPLLCDDGNLAGDDEVKPRRLLSALDEPVALVEDPHLEALDEARALDGGHCCDDRRRPAEVGEGVSGGSAPPAGPRSPAGSAAMSTRASRRAQSRIDGRVAVALAGLGMSESSAISPKKAPAPSRASARVNLLSPCAAPREISTSPRTTTYASLHSSPSRMTRFPAGTVTTRNTDRTSRSAPFERALKRGKGRTRGRSSPRASS